MTALEKFGQLPIMEQASLLSKSNLVPKAFRGKPADIVIALLWGEEVGLGPTSSLSYIDVIEGNATINAEGSNALIRRAGHSLIVDVTNERAVVKGKRHDTGDEMTVTWTMQMARDAGLANKQVWKQYPQAMLTSRAVSQISRALFADVFLGITYTPEEAASFAAPDMLNAQPQQLVEATTGQAALPPANHLPVSQVMDAITAEAPVEVASKPTPKTFAPPQRSQSVENTQRIMAELGETPRAAQPFTPEEQTLVTAVELKALRDEIDALDLEAAMSLTDAWKEAGLPSVKGKKSYDKTAYETAMNLVLDAKVAMQERLAATPVEGESLWDAEQAASA